jgi:soluble lytic murein transglycosylase
LAECDLYQQRHHKALDGLKPYLEHASRQAEAFFFYTSATRQLGNHDEYVRLSRQLVERFPESTWAEDALNNLATHFIVNNEDEQADQVFRDVLARFPTGRYAERAAWKAGWWAYKHARYQETIRIFEQASGAFPRSDYRPAFLYWSGRAYEAVGDRTAAAARLALVVTDYRNSYYGRLAARGAPAPRERTAAAVADAAAEGAETDGTFDLPPNAAQIRALIGLELYDQALDEVTCASRTYGPSPVLVATEAWLQNKRGDLRRGITLMKRAYPQYLTDGGEHLPHEILEVIFPVDHWPAIQQRAKARGLDPYLVAALIAQESTFVPDIRSSANAIGLMQVLPSTGRRYARRLGIRRFTPALLTRPDVNLRLGVAIFADLVKRFGGVHLALASYNAGESRVVKWIAERPGIERDEFIDDIPFPETQNYVKRILGTAEDYRAIYGSAGATSRGTSKTPAAVRTGAAPQPKPKPTRKPPAARGKRPTSQAPSN